VKYFFYLIFLAASLGAVAAITNPAIFQQGAAFIGLELPLNSDEPAEKISSEDQLARFLSQYPSGNNSFGNTQHNDILHATNPPHVPMVVVPEPAQPPLPPIYETSAYAPPAPEYAQAWDSTNANWDAGNGNWEQTNWNADPTPQSVPASPYDSYTNPSHDFANSLPTDPFDVSQHSAPILPDHWSGPAQPYQEPMAATPAPQQSVYGVTPPQESFATVQTPVVPASNFQEIPNFEQTRYTPPNQTLPTQTMPPQTMIESVPVYGTEMVARVGTQFILLGDVLPKLRRLALQIVQENLKKMPEMERANVPHEEVEQFVSMFVEKHYADVLEQQIMLALIYSDYDASMGTEQKNFFDSKKGEEFDRTEIPAMIEEFNVENIVALRRYLEEQFGSSLEKERRLWIREQIVREWVGMSMQRATGECTYEEMEDFYNANLAMFTSTARARWQEMVVLLSNHNTEQDAWNKISWMGNQVARGAPFEDIAKANSEGFTASNGGTWDWTTRGSLTSAELEQAVFSQPVGQLSSVIIRSNRGLHIIRVLEREEESVVPFIQAQNEIRNRIRNQRAQRYESEYFADLRRRFPPVIVRERIDFNVGLPRTASNMP